MVRRAVGVVLGLVLTASCAGGPQAPTPVNLTQATQPPPAAAPPPRTTIVGTYSASLLLPACTGLPASDRRRTYTARIDQDERTGLHVVSLSDATFLDSLPSRFHPVPMHPHQFLASLDQGEATFSMFADWESSFGGRIVERTATGRWIMVEGGLTGRATADAITATGPGTVFYCDAARDDFRDECTGITVLCSTPLTLTLAPR
jgi:hypothetical protein